LINIRNVPTREKAYSVLLDAIVKGTLKSGERLIEDSLAQQFSVSRTPLREAIHKLEMEGFVARLPMRGVMVAEISVRQAQELSEVRSYLEGLATRLTAQRLTTSEEKELLVMRMNIQASLQAKDYTELGEENRLHSFVREACKHKVCSDHLIKLRQHFLRYRNISLLYPQRRLDAAEEHLKIIDFIIARRGEEAETIMKEHVINSSASTIANLEKVLRENRL
jgi:DNA-binding GntR family transcriptional regulator